MFAGDKSSLCRFFPRYKCAINYFTTEKFFTLSSICVFQKLLLFGIPKCLFYIFCNHIHIACVCVCMCVYTHSYANVVNNNYALPLNYKIQKQNMCWQILYFSELIKKYSYP